MITDLLALRLHVAVASERQAEADIARRLKRAEIAAALIAGANPATGKPWSQTAADDAARIHPDYLASERAAIAANLARERENAEAEALRLRIDYALVSLRAGAAGNIGS